MENIEIQETEVTETTGDNLVMSDYDYYDRYYEQVTTSLTSIEQNQQTMIENQKNMISGFDVLAYLVSVIVIYLLIHNMLKR